MVHLGQVDPDLSLASDINTLCDKAGNFLEPQVSFLCEAGVTPLLMSLGYSGA